MKRNCELIGRGRLNEWEHVKLKAKALSWTNSTCKCKWIINFSIKENSKPFHNHTTGGTSERPEFSELHGRWHGEVNRLAHNTFTYIKSTFHHFLRFPIFVFFFLLNKRISLVSARVRHWTHALDYVCMKKASEKFSFVLIRFLTHWCVNIFLREENQSV